MERKSMGLSVYRIFIRFFSLRAIHPVILAQLESPRAEFNHPHGPDTLRPQAITLREWAGEKGAESVWFHLHSDDTAALIVSAGLGRIGAKEKRRHRRGLKCSAPGKNHVAEAG
jgi:hypothetical protein